MYVNIVSVWRKALSVRSTRAHHAPSSQRITQSADNISKTETFIIQVVVWLLLAQPCTHFKYPNMIW